MSVHPSQYIHLIIKTNDLTAALAEVNSRTAGIFGNVEAHAEGESILNCMPATFCYITLPDGSFVGRVAIDPAYETLWPIGQYDCFEIVDYPAWYTIEGDMGGEIVKIPNREPYNCGTVTDEDGNTRDIPLGSWGC